MLKNYYLGCPFWSNKDWNGKLYTPKAKPKDYLKQYGQVFNTVEANSTFYTQPKQAMIIRWRSETPPHFRFVFKLPKVITHIYKLRHIQQELQNFYKNMQPINDKVGLYFIQLPPSFSAKGLPTLEKFLPLLSKDFTYALEVRHTDFFTQKQTKERLHNALELHGINLALFDTPTLHSIKVEEASALVREAQRKKPSMPRSFDTIAHTQSPMLRYVGYETVNANITALQPVVNIVAEWIAAGKHPYVFMHTPGDVFAPNLCRQFHKMLMSACPIDVGVLPKFKDEQQQSQQMSLF